MIDSFPFDEWSEDITAFWTFGPENSTGTYVLTVLGVIVMIVSLIGWVWLENKKLSAQAELLRGAGALPGPSPSLPPSAPPTDPGI